MYLSISQSLLQSTSNSTSKSFSVFPMTFVTRKNPLWHHCRPSDFKPEVCHVLPVSLTVAHMRLLLPSAASSEPETFHRYHRYRPNGSDPPPGFERQFFPLSKDTCKKRTSRRLLLLLLLLPLRLSSSEYCPSTEKKIPVRHYVDRIVCSSVRDTASGSLECFPPEEKEVARPIFAGTRVEEHFQFLGSIFQRRVCVARRWW